MIVAALRPTVRSQPWVPLAIAISASTALVVAMHDRTGPVSLQVSAIVLASGLGYALDDPSFEVLAPSPTSLLRRRSLRLVSQLVLVVAWGSLLMMWQGTASNEETWALVLLFGGLASMGLGIAGLAARRSPYGRGGAVVAPALFVLIVLSSIVSPRWRPLPLGDVPGGWAAIYLRWGAAAVVGALGFMISSRDPAMRWVAGRRARGYQ